MAWNIEIPKAEYFDHNNPNLESLVREVYDQKEVAIDTETTGLVRWKDLPLYWSLAWGKRRVTLNASVLPYFKDVFANENINWILASAKYDMHILANVGVTLAGACKDIQVEHALLYDDRSHKLKEICEHIMGWRWSDFQTTFGKINAKQTAEQLIRKAEQENFGLLVEYAADDAWGTLNSHHVLQKQLSEAGTHSLFRDTYPYIHTLWDIFEKIEVPFTRVLFECERNGVLINMEYMNSIAPNAELEIVDIEKEISKLAGYVLNPRSVSEKSDYFFNKMKFRPSKMTKGGKSGVRKPAVDASVLEKFAADGDPMAKLMLRHAELSKLYGTYIQGMSSLVDPCGRLHTSFNQDIARTGRLSSSDPNLQNLPRPENDKWKLRGGFIASEGSDLIVADYEQLEMRLLAAASQEAGMIQVINNGWDIHMGNASMIFGYPYEEIKAAKDIEKKVKAGQLPPEAMTDRVIACLDARTTSKTLGFGLVYGMGPDKLANALNITKDEAIQRLEQFKKAYPAVDAFTKEAVEETKQTGYSFTIMGRRRNMADIRSPNKMDRSKAERQAVNTPIQGSAADVVKCAQILCRKAGIEKRYGARMLLQVHDELVFECPKEMVKEAKAEIKEWMEHPFSSDLPVPLDVAIGSGRTWLEAK